MLELYVYKENKMQINRTINQRQDFGRFRVHDGGASKLAKEFKTEEMLNKFIDSVATPLQDLTADLVYNKKGLFVYKKMKKLEILNNFYRRPKSKTINFRVQEGRLEMYHSIKYPTAKEAKAIMKEIEEAPIVLRLFIEGREVSKSLAEVSNRKIIKKTKKIDSKNLSPLEQKILNLYG